MRVVVRVFNERGYDGTSIQDLSTELGISKSAIYYHVASKDELLELALDRALDGLTAATESARGHPGRAIDRLDHLVRTSVEILVEQLPFVTLLLRVRGNTAVERAALARRREFDQEVTALVQQAESEGDVRPDIDPAITARLLFGMINSLTEWYRPGGPLEADQLADAIHSVAFNGLRLRDPR